MCRYPNSASSAPSCKIFSGWKEFDGLQCKEEGRITKNIKSESTKRKMRSRGHCAEIAHPWKELKLRASGKQGLGGTKKSGEQRRTNRIARCITHERSTTCGRRTSGRTMGKRTGRATAVNGLASNNLQRRGQAADNGRTTGKHNQQLIVEQRVAPANKKSLGDFEGEANSRRLIGGDQRHETIRRLPLNMERARTLNGIRIQSESRRAGTSTAPEQAPEQDPNNNPNMLA